MKKSLKYRSFFLCFLSVFIMHAVGNNLYAQKTKKNKARINVQYVKIVRGAAYFDIKVSARIKKKNVKISNIEISIFNVIDDEKIIIGKTITDKEGKSRFKLESLNQIKTDSSLTYHMLFSFKGNASYKKVNKKINFKDVGLTAEIITKDSINYIHATLSHADSMLPIKNTPLIVQVQRLFKPLLIGEEFNNTDEAGSINVAIEDGIPGIDGILTFEVVLNESDEYGTVKAMVKGPIGKQIVLDSTFDQRTMWSPRNKTPIFLLIFPNLLIVGVWGLIFYLILNLYKLSKS